MYKGIGSSVFCLLLCSCIRPEAPNAEADIIACTLQSEYIKNDPLITNNKVTFMALSRIDRTRLAPQFEISPGATIDPPGGTVRDFSRPQTYRVRSEDGKWEKTYTLTVDTSDLSVRYHFEQYETIDQKYHAFYELIPVPGGASARQDVWASANPGFTLTGMGSTPEQFPTVSIPDGQSGRGVLLQTRSTGIFGSLLAKPIAAGNFFIGSFDASKVMSNHLEATRFGLPFGKKPLAIRGFYTYKAGPVFTNSRSEEIPGRKDEGLIYAVFYETDETVNYLNGTNIGVKPGNIQHPNILGRAELAPFEETEEWRYFEIPFVYDRAVDPEKLKAYKYNFTIVCSSGKWGDLFEGAAGSRLCIDEVEVVCE
ncbi:MAG: PCMD domain-containing protein [Culturomica sp.]|jgi:hypothetical protein|nr:PCMD domain-containing protein [Culturomica sp.]